MKQLLMLSTLLLSLATSAYGAPKYLLSGECALTAAEAARTFAAKNWNTAEASIEIKVSEVVRSSNPAPIEIYAVGLLSPAQVPVLFSVALKNIGGNCNVVDVDFAEYLN